MPLIQIEKKIIFFEFNDFYFNIKFHEIDGTHLNKDVCTAIVLLLSILLFSKLIKYGFSCP